MSHLVCEIHPREDKYLSGLVETSGPGPSYRLVPFSPGVRYHSHTVQSSSHGLICYQRNVKLPLYVPLLLDCMVWKEDAFQHPWNDVSAYTFPPFILLRQVLSRVMLLTNLSLVLVAHLLPQKEWFTDLLALRVKEPIKFPLLWNLLVQLHIRSFHKSLEMLQLYTLKMSSDLSARLAFQKRLHRWSLWTIEDPQHFFTRKVV